MPSAGSLNFSVKITKDLKGVTLERLQAAVDGATKDTASAIEADVKGAGPHAQNAMSLTGPRGGKVYVPSAPGTPPRPRTGNLRRSYHIDWSQWSKHILTVGNDPAIADYAPFVELGTRFMEARPHLGPALEFQRPKFIERIRENLR